MKIIRLTEGWDEGRFDVDFHPDSALLLPGRPLFYPDFADGWVAWLYVAVHVNRLGKSVSEKFASRYYDGLAFALRVAPADTSMMPQGLLSGLDSSITHGRLLLPDECAGMSSVTVNGEPVAVSLPDTAALGRAVSRASVSTTLRMGDLILIPLGVDAFVITPRSRFVITCGGLELMNVKIV